jgi:BolA protein
MSEERRALVDERLRAALTIDELVVEDESHKHAGHAGAQAGGSHLRVRVVSPDFEGCNRIQRHRLVYRAVGDAMRTDIIHMLSISAVTPAEAVDAGSS